MSQHWSVRGLLSAHNKIHTDIESECKQVNLYPILTQSGNFQGKDEHFVLSLDLLKQFDYYLFIDQRLSSTVSKLGWFLDYFWGRINTDKCYKYSPKKYVHIQRIKVNINCQYITMDPLKPYRSWFFNPSKRQRQRKDILSNPFILQQCHSTYL